MLADSSSTIAENGRGIEIGYLLLVARHAFTLAATLEDLANRIWDEATLLESTECIRFRIISIENESCDLIIIRLHLAMFALFFLFNLPTSKSSADGLLMTLDKCINGQAKRCSKRGTDDC